MKEPMADEKLKKIDRIIPYKVTYTDGQNTNVLADNGESAQKIAEKMRPDAKVQSTTNKNK